MKTSNTLKVKLLSPKGRLPVKGTSLATGYDLSSAQQLIIPVNGRAIVQTDISLSVPKGTYGRIASRSGLAVKHGITTGAGVIDADYTGPIGVVLFNHGDQDFQIREGDRIAQLILKHIADKPVIEVQDLTPTQQGNKGFGSTGGQQINNILGCKGNNKYSNNNHTSTQDNDGRGEQDGKVNAYKRSPLRSPDLCNRASTPEHHAPTRSNDHECSSLSPPVPSPRHTPSATLNRISPLPFIATVLDSEESPSGLKSRAWNSSSESCLAPSSSLSQVQLLKSRNSEGGLRYNEEEEEEETDSNSGSDPLDCTRGMKGEEEMGAGPSCPSLLWGRGERMQPPHPPQYLLHWWGQRQGRIGWPKLPGRIAAKEPNDIQSDD